MKGLKLLVLLVSLSLVVDVDAGWKFWKKKKDESTSTVSPLAGSTASSTVAVPAKATSQRPKSSIDTSKGIASSADSVLAIGVGNFGGKINEEAKNQARKSDPSTNVGPSKPPGSDGDWIADLSGFEGGSHRKVTPTPGHRPTVAPNSGIAGGKPATPFVGTPTNALHQTPTPVTPQSKTSTMNWADIVGGRNNHGSTTSTYDPGLYPNVSQPPNPKSEQAKHGSSTPNRRPTNLPPEPVRPSGGQFKRPGISNGAAIGGAALVGGSAAGAAIGSGKGSSSNPTYSKGNTVTDEDLQKLSEALFTKDINNANKYITLNLQKTTTGNNPKDEAAQPLLQVKPEALQMPTIQKVLAIYDNYKLDTRESEYISPAQRQEESLLVDTFLSTNLMSAAMRFLADKGFIKKDYYEYKDTLRTLWFNLYSRGEGKIGSSGFEHVFLTELKLGNEVSGLHNWIYFNAEELKKRLDYLGYIKKIDLGNKAAIVKAHVRFNGIDKPVTNIFVGTSPELEMALYTVCFIVRPEQPCAVSLGGTKFNIITHKFRYRGRDLIGSAYPEI